MVFSRRSWGQGTPGDPGDPVGDDVLAPRRWCFMGVANIIWTDRWTIFMRTFKIGESSKRDLFHACFMPVSCLFHLFYCFINTPMKYWNFPQHMIIIDHRRRKSFDQALFQSLEASYDEHRAAWHRAMHRHAHGASGNLLHGKVENHHD